MSSLADSSAGLLKTRSATPQEQKLIADVLGLYQLKPNHQAYSHYAENAVFHDPVSIAKGLDSIKSQFNGMPKLFAESETKQVDVLETSTPEKLQLNLTQRYVFKSPIPGREKGTEKTVNSKLTFQLNSQGLIVEHDEEWDHQANKDGDEGFMGKLQAARKVVDAKLVEKTVPSDPDRL